MSSSSTHRPSFALLLDEKTAFVLLAPLVVVRYDRHQNLHQLF